MGEMKRIVTPEVLVDELPEHVRRGIDSGTRVKVTVEAGGDASPAPRPLREFFGAGRGLYATPEEAVEFIRSLRDEWDD